MLVVALAVMGMWARSQVVADRLYFRLHDTEHVILSTSRGLRWYSFKWPLPGTWSLQTGVRYDELRFTQMHRVFGPNGELRGTVPYWWIVVPLSLLSAILVLIPSGKRPPAASRPHA
jgi:hypothetical protein